jgi:hypothetical protein
MRLKSVLLATIVIAMPARPSVLPCQTGSLASYEALASGCLIGDVLFDNFKYNPDTIISTVGGVAATGVTVTPIAGPEFGLMFSGSYSAGMAEVEDAFLTFDVDSQADEPVIDGFGLAIDAAATQSGSVVVGENADNFAYHLETYVIASGSQLSAGKTISPAVSSLNLKKDILLDGGANGTASLNSFTETFSLAPEPGTGLLSNSVLFLLSAGFLWRRRALYKFDLSRIPGVGDSDPAGPDRASRG